MRTESVYVLDCPCGERVESHEREVVCGNCGRLLAIERWGEPVETVR